MLTVDDYGAIRRARRDGKSIRRIALDFGHSRNTIRYVLKHPEPGSQTRNRNAPVLGPFQAVIDQILADDEDAPPKQRHTAAQVCRRLRDEHGYHGCYGQVQRISASTTARTVRPSSPWDISPASASRPTSVTFTSTSPTVGGRDFLRGGLSGG